MRLITKKFSSELERSEHMSEFSQMCRRDPRHVGSEFVQILEGRYGVVVACWLYTHMVFWAMSLVEEQGTDYLSRHSYQEGSTITVRLDRRHRLARQASLHDDSRLVSNSWSNCPFPRRRDVMFFHTPPGNAAGPAADIVVPRHAAGLGRTTGHILFSDLGPAQKGRSYGAMVGTLGGLLVGSKLEVEQRLRTISSYAAHLFRDVRSGKVEVRGLGDLLVTVAEYHGMLQRGVPEHSGELHEAIVGSGAVTLRGLFIRDGSHAPRYELARLL